MMRRLIFTLLGVGCWVLGVCAWTADDVTVIDDFVSYSGAAPMVYCKADEKVYVMNNLGGYEEYGVVETVDGLDILSDKDIAYIETTYDMAGLGSASPYINTGYRFKASTRVVCDYEINGHQYNYESPFGSRNGSYWNNAFVFFSRFNRMNTGNFNRSGVETQGDMELETGVRYVIDATGQTATIYQADDMSSPYMEITTTGTVDDGVNSMYVFNLNTGGINDNLIASVNAALKARELVKGRVLENSMLSAREACDALCESCAAEPVQVIGTKFVIFKRNHADPKIELVKSKKK